MNIFCVDDNLLHRTRAKQVIEEAFRVRGLDLPSVTECSDGEDFFERSKAKNPDLVLLDIHMPVLDGLSTLVRLRHVNRRVKVIMVSSENKHVIKRFKKDKERSEIGDEKKRQLLEKVVYRVVSGQIEEGKINSILDACSNLELDPVSIAGELGADAYIQKPYDVTEAGRQVSEFL